jgi:hypothetical protein
MTNTEQTDTPNISETPNLAALRAWADARGLSVHASSGSQREPENVVAVKFGGGFGTTLLSRSSLDSIDTAAMYLVNVIDRLRLED